MTVPLRDMTVAELAWLAGLIEGEGAFTTNNGGHNPRIVMSMTDEDVVRRAHVVSGVGRVGGPYQQKNNRSTTTVWKPTWRWDVSKTEDALDLMELLYPLMGERRQQKIDELLTQFGRPTQEVPPEFAAA